MKCGGLICAHESALNTYTCPSQAHTHAHTHSHMHKVQWHKPRACVRQQQRLQLAARGGTSNACPRCRCRCRCPWLPTPFVLAGVSLFLYSVAFCSRFCLLFRLRFRFSRFRLSNFSVHLEFETRRNETN